MLDILGNMNLSAEDQDTLQVLATAINTNGSGISIDGTVLNAVVIADSSGNDTKISTGGLKSIVDRLSSSALTALFQHESKVQKSYWGTTLLTADVLEEIIEKNPTIIHQMTDEDKKVLQDIIEWDANHPTEVGAARADALDKVLEIANTPESSISVLGAFNFGTVSIKNLYTDDFIKSHTGVAVTGVLGPDQHVSVESSKWVSESDPNVVFSPTLTMELTRVTGNLQVNSIANLVPGAPIDVVPGAVEGKISEKFNVFFDVATLTDFPATLTEGNYSSTLTWSIVAGPGNNVS